MNELNHMLTAFRNSIRCNCLPLISRNLFKQFAHKLQLTQKNIFKGGFATEKDHIQLIRDAMRTDPAIISCDPGTPIVYGMSQKAALGIYQWILTNTDCHLFSPQPQQTSPKEFFPGNTTKCQLFLSTPLSAKDIKFPESLPGNSSMDNMQPFPFPSEDPAKLS